MNRAENTAAGVEVERAHDATYVFIDNEFAGSLAPQYALGYREAVICGWFVRDERVAVSYGARARRQAPGRRDRAGPPARDHPAVLT